MSETCKHCGGSGVIFVSKKYMHDGVEKERRCYGTCICVNKKFQIEYLSKIEHVHVEDTSGYPEFNDFSFLLGSRKVLAPYLRWNLIQTHYPGDYKIWNSNKIKDLYYESRNFYNFDELGVPKLIIIHLYEGEILNVYFEEILYNFLLNCKEMQRKVWMISPFNFESLKIRYGVTLYNYVKDNFEVYDIGDTLEYKGNAISESMNKVSKKATNSVTIDKTKDLSIDDNKGIKKGKIVRYED